MCESPATSREHAPPLCFFPAGTGRDLRRNLVTVPSCEPHNSQQSKDDEYLRAVILMNAARTSEAGRRQFFEKLLRAAWRRPHAYRTFVRDRGTIADGKGRALQIDRDRFDACIDRLARALCFDAYDHKWNLPITVISPNLFSEIASDQPVPHQPTVSAVAVSRELLGGEPIRGENPEIFKYRLRYESAAGAFAFAAIFYDCFEVYGFSSEEMAKVAV